jgi:protein gp37
MAENSKIEWCDHTFNPWVGCTKISPACDNCYAESWAYRAGRANLWQGHRSRTSEANWREPLKWNRKAQEAGVRARVFCASLADVFDNQVPEEWRLDLYKLIRDTPHLDWMLLTKRPQNIKKFFPQDGAAWTNVWLGTTVENQEQVSRLDHLLANKAAMYFASCEPMLEPLDIKKYLMGEEEHGVDWSREVGSKVGACIGWRSGLDMVICGGESGSGARIWPGFFDAARSLRNQCRAYNVAFFMKQTQGVSKRSMPPIPDDLMIREIP